MDACAPKLKRFALVELAGSKTVNNCSCAHITPFCMGWYGEWKLKQSNKQFPNRNNRTIKGTGIGLLGKWDRRQRAQSASGHTTQMQKVLVRKPPKPCKMDFCHIYKFSVIACKHGFPIRTNVHVDTYFSYEWNATLIQWNFVSFAQSFWICGANARCWKPCKINFLLSPTKKCCVWHSCIMLWTAFPSRECRAVDSLLARVTDIYKVCAALKKMTAVKQKSPGVGKNSLIVTMLL